MRPSTVTARFSRLYHMTEPGSWPTVRKHGLLSTTAILDMARLGGEHRFRLESQKRSASVEVVAGDATFILRDQKPVHPGKLQRCLTDMTVSEWLTLLSGKVFFWPTRRRCEELALARAYRDRSHLVLEVDTAELIRRHGDRVTLSPINAGSTLYNPPQRGSFTFVQVQEYEQGMRVAEVAVDYSVPDIAELVVGRYLVHGDTWVAITD